MQRSLKTLNQLEPLQIFQETLRGIQNGKLFDFQPDKIQICPGIQGQYNACGRKLTLPENLMMEGIYLDEDANEHKFSLTRLILHETQHGIDPGILGELKYIVEETARITGYSTQESCEIVSKLFSGEMNIPSEKLKEITSLFSDKMPEIWWGEHIAISRENPVMELFFDEKPRAYYTDLRESASEVTSYRLKPATPNFECMVNKARYIATPITEVCRDIAGFFDEVASKNPVFAATLQGKKEETVKNFPNGKLRQFEK